VRSIIASLRSLTLPFGATSGKRIELDGVNGTIEVYDVDGDLRVRIGQSSNGSIELGTGDPDELLMGDLTAYPTSIASDPARQLQIVLESPRFSGGADISTIVLNGESFDHSIPSSMGFYTDVYDFYDHVSGATAVVTFHGAVIAIGDLSTQNNLDVDGNANVDGTLTVDGTSTLTGDVSVAGRSISRGIVGYAERTTDLTLSTTAGTLSTLCEDTTVSLINGHQYLITQFGGSNLLIGGSGFAATDQWNMKLQHDLGSGYIDIVKGGASRLMTRGYPAISTRYHIPPMSAVYTASATGTVPFRSQAAKQVGAATVTSVMESASGANPFILMVEDLSTPV